MPERIDLLFARATRAYDTIVILDRFAGTQTGCRSNQSSLFSWSTRAVARANRSHANEQERLRDQHNKIEIIIAIYIKHERENAVITSARSRSG